MADLKPALNISPNSQIDEKKERKEKEEQLNMLSKELVSSIINKMDTQSKITKLTLEFLKPADKRKGKTAIETSKILDYISKTMSSEIVKITKTTLNPQRQKLIYGLAQTAAEVSIITAFKDITYATAMSKKQSIDSLRRRRSLTEELLKIITPVGRSVVKINSTSNHDVLPNNLKASAVPSNRFSVLPDSEKVSIRLMESINEPISKGFFNETTLNNDSVNGVNEPVAIIVTNKINEALSVIPIMKIDSEKNVEVEKKSDENSKYVSTDDVFAEVKSDQTDLHDILENNIYSFQEHTESNAKAGIVYSGDVAYLTAASVMALRRALTALNEVKMSVKNARNGLVDQDQHIMNLAKIAAREVGKEAKNASSKSFDCEKALKQAIKYVAESSGANLSHEANRVLIDAAALASIAKSMAYVSSVIATEAMYEVMEMK